MKALAMVAPNRICKSGIQFKRNNMFPMFIYTQNNKEIIKKVLSEIKPLSRFSDEEEVPMWAIEKAIAIMCKKYNMRVSNITSDIFGNDTCIIWKGDIITDGFRIVGTW